MATLPHVRHQVVHEKGIQAPLVHADAVGEERKAERRFLAGLTVASLASAILSTTFDLFYVDTFLSAYELPLTSYAFGTLIYTVISMTNDVGGAWLVDSIAMRSSRSTVVGRTGYIFAGCFLVPFFRSGYVKLSPALATAHFIVSLSLYDTIFTFSTILFGSMFTDNHELSEKTRVNFMASGKLVNLVASFVVARVGLSVFSTDDLKAFRLYALVLSAASCTLFMSAQRMIRPKKGSHKDESKPTSTKLSFRRVVKDFAGHSNFRVWIVMEALLECQVRFSASFSKTFVDRLLLEMGMPEEAADWLLALIGPMSQILAIVYYMPIRRIGYIRIYSHLFQVKIAMALCLLIFGSPSSTYLVTVFLVLNQVLTSAVQTSGFHLAMSDMVAELKLAQMKSGRFGEPSLAGLFIGANALACKPIDSVLPIIAAWSLARVGFKAETHSHLFRVKEEQNVSDVRQVLFRLLVIPPLVFSVIQLAVWRKYNLEANRAEEVRLELKKIRRERRDSHGEMHP